MSFRCRRLQMPFWSFENFIVLSFFFLLDLIFFFAFSQSYVVLPSLQCFACACFLLVHYTNNNKKHNTQIAMIKLIHSIHEMIEKNGRRVRWKISTEFAYRVFGIKQTKKFNSIHTGEIDREWKKGGVVDFGVWFFLLCCSLDIIFFLFCRCTWVFFSSFFGCDFV